ncbi:MAG: methylmalonyl-CoA epimerase [Chloroflexota bacterium]|nr:methylmalonyl-CoA epimerase [Chloroflexota bacterium]
MERPRGLPILRLHHVGILVEDLDSAVRFYSGFLGIGAGQPQTAPEHDIRAVLLDVGDTHLEIFAPLSADGPIARTLAKRGPGQHHVAYEVADIDAALEACRQAGLELIDGRARPGLHHGWRVAFLHPRSCGGVLTELIETGAPWQGTGL